MSARDGILFSLNVNGFSVEAVYDAKELIVVDQVIDELVSIRKRSPKREKTVAFLSGPPGAGKSTLGLCISERANRSGAEFSFECLGLDGFHKTCETLMSTYTEIGGRKTLLNDIKGAPETFDAEAFKEALRRVKSAVSDRWPVYDRRMHDVSKECAKVKGDILIVEGNWLMLSGIWEEARSSADRTYALDESDEALKERLIARKMRGGKSKAEAEAWFERVDGPNIDLYRTQSARSDVHIERKNGILVLSDKNL